MIRMKKREIFNKLYENGISYQNYVENSEKYLEKMEANYNVAQKSIKTLSPDQIIQMNEKIHILCIAESWCIDCANGVPIIAAISNIMNNWDFRISFRDKWQEEFNSFYSFIVFCINSNIDWTDNDGFKKCLSSLYVISI